MTLYHSLPLIKNFIIQPGRLANVFLFWYCIMCNWGEFLELNCKLKTNSSKDELLVSLKHTFS